MLILTRKSGESFFIGDEIEVTVFDIQSDKIRIGINAPEHVRIVRKEIKEIKDENVKASETASKEKIKNLNKYLAASNQLKSLSPKNE